MDPPTLTTRQPARPSPALSPSDWLVGCMEEMELPTNSKEVVKMTGIQNRGEREADAWAGYVGSQTPQEFMAVSREKYGGRTIEFAVLAYMQESEMFSATDWLDTTAMQDIASLLVGYIRHSLVNR